MSCRRGFWAGRVGKVVVTPLVHTDDMTRQLALITTDTVEDSSRDDEGWRLDETTREAGRRGLAAAREALAEAARRRTAA